MSDASVAAQIAKFECMSTDELRQQYEAIYSEPARSRNRRWLFRRVAWGYQARYYGGLSEEAQARLEELMPTAELALRTPPGRVPEPRSRTQDPRLPKPGTVLLKTHKGRRHAVEVLDEGFSYDGRVFRSLSAVARAITGTRWNGWAFFGLNEAQKK